ncbi:MAG: hypothetical protein U0T82_08945 [Bacteroidales bacterium]
MTTQESLNNLFSTPAWWEKARIQASTARSYKKRFQEGKLSLETQMDLLEKSGFVRVVEMQWEKRNEAGNIREKLIHKLKEEKAFWSYDLIQDEQITDEWLIEKVLVHLDLEDSQELFRIFNRKLIQKVWRDTLLKQEPIYHGLNRLYARLYFGMRDPDRYIRNFHSATASEK